MKFKLSILALACSALVANAQSTDPTTYQTTEYFSSGALSYMNLEKYKRENIKIYVTNFNHLPYNILILYT